MIVRTLGDILNTEHDVEADTWTSRRLLLKRDGMGFSLHDTIIHADTETPMEYRNHLEAVYCIDGEGEIEDCATGEIFPIRPGTVYALDKHDAHRLRAKTALRLVCVFNPPLTGREVHDADGAYPLCDDGDAEPSDTTYNATEEDRMGPMSDRYESREVSEAALIQREDPVVYPPLCSSYAEGLNETELRFYEDNGYLQVDNFFSPREIARLRQELTRLLNSPRINEREETIREPDSGAVRSVFSIHTLDGFFAKLCRDRRLLTVAEQILGSAVYLHQSRANLKPGFEGKEFYWHSDFETWHVEDGMPAMRALSCSIALTDNNEQNGPLLVIPGSHRVFVSCVGQTPEEHFRASLRSQRYGIPDPLNLRLLTEQGGIASMTGKAGSVVFFDCNLMHGSNSNITPHARSNLFLVFNSVENRLGHPNCGLKPRPEFIATRKKTMALTPLDPEDYLLGDVEAVS